MNQALLTEIAQMEVRSALRSLPEELRLVVARAPVFFESTPNAEDVAAGVEPGHARSL